MYTFSRFYAYNTHTHTVVYQGNGTEENVFEKRIVFKEDLKELIRGRMMGKNRELVQDSWSPVIYTCYTLFFKQIL